VEDAKFVSSLLALNQGEAGVLRDKPERHYYVAYITRREPLPSIDDALETNNRRPMLSKLQEEQRKKWEESIMQELRRQASGGQLDARGRFELGSGVEEKRSGGSSE
jgi:hypothetical protein